ncbi:mucin-binding protein [Lacticaseibacillus parakribbianus]|uniref:mucin-binding protein n=1 Tax=Lacticaseibacillus parakribbianus TaxID=2970927 RepID=UPI0021CB8AB1|nr:KxYKxGKxW signal peptide domain-containing protein [Lacticaseibacillus parakribbianus]
MSRHSSTHLKDSTTERKLRFRLYKSGKFWLVAGTAFGIWLAKPHSVGAASAEGGEAPALTTAAPATAKTPTVPLRSSVSSVNEDTPAPETSTTTEQPTDAGAAETAATDQVASETGPGEPGAKPSDGAGDAPATTTESTAGTTSSATDSDDTTTDTTGPDTLESDQPAVPTAADTTAAGPKVAAPTAAASPNAQSKTDSTKLLGAVTTAASTTAGKLAAVNDIEPDIEEPDDPPVITTHSATITGTPAWDAKVISGTATPGNTVKLWRGGELATTTVASDGSWTFDLAGLDPDLDLTKALAVREYNPSGQSVGVVAVPYYQYVTHQIIQRDGMKTDASGNYLDQFSFTDYVLIPSQASLSGDTVNLTFDYSPIYSWPPLRHSDFPVIDGLVAQWRAIPERVSVSNVTTIDAIYYFPATIQVSPLATNDDVTTAVTPKVANTPVSSLHLISPNYPAGVTTTDLTKTVTRTIHFVDEAGDTVAPDVVQEVKYTRIGTVSFLTNPPTVSYSNWVAADPVWSEAAAPLVKELVPSQTTVAAVTTTGDTGDETVTITYFPQIVNFEGPKDAGTPVSTNPDDPRKYPEGMTPADSYLTKTRTIVLINAVTGESFNEDTRQEVRFVRRGVLDFGQTPPAITQSEWWVLDIQWGGFFAPAKPGMVAGPTSIPAQSVFETSDDVTVYIRYYPSVEVVTSDNPKTPGDKVGLDDEDPRVYPDGLTVSDLKRTISRTITFVGLDGDPVAATEHQEVTFTRSATVDWRGDNPTLVYSDWTTANASFDEVPSPVVPDLVPARATTKALTVTATDADVQTMVLYFPAIAEVSATAPQDGGTPVSNLTDDPRVYPADVGKTNLNKTVTRTIKYVTTEGTVLGTVAQEIAYTRDASVNFSTGTGVTSYEPWQTTDAVWPARSNPDFVGWVAGTSTVVAVTTTADTPDETVTVVYYPDQVTVTSDAPKNPGDKVSEDPTDSRTYPAGVAANELKRSITRTITFVNGMTGDTVATDVVQTVTFTRDATVAFGAGDPVVSYTPWQSTDDQWSALTSPVLPGLLANSTDIEAVTTTEDTASVAVNVSYYPDQVTVTPDQPKNPGDAINPEDPNDNRVYPEGVAQSDLVRTVTRTIQYQLAGVRADFPSQNQQTVTYTRNATVNLATGAVSYSDWTTANAIWSSVTSPDVPQLVPSPKQVPAFTTSDDSSDETVTVLYYPAILTVTPADPKEPGEAVDPTNPEDDREYPAGVSQQDLTKTVTRTIKYVDETGQPVAADVIQPVIYTRAATVDLNAGVTYTDWTSTDATWAATTSPSVVDMLTFTKVVAESATSASTTDETVVVTYFPAIITVEPTAPHNPGDPIESTNPDDNREYPAGVTAKDLNRTIFRIINYSANNGDLAASTVIQPVTYTRSATINLNQLSATDPTAGITYSAWTTADETWPAVTSPSISSWITFTKQVDVATTTVDTPTTIVNVIYYPSLLTITADEPQAADVPVDATDPNDKRVYPAGVDTDDLNRTITRTITYVNADGTQLGDVVTQVVKYTRSATIDLNRVDASDPLAGITYTQWSTTDAEWPQVKTPERSGLIPNAPEVRSVTTTQDTADAAITVTYYPAGLTISPDSPKQPGEAVDPSNSDDNRVYPAGVDTDDLNRTITRTITYVNADGTQLGGVVTQVVKYTRSATIDLNLMDASDPLAGITYTQWSTTDAEWPQVASPARTGMIPNMKEVEARITSPVTVDSTITVVYFPATITVSPDNPKNPGDKVSPDDPNDNREYPAGVTAADLKRAVTRVISYVDELGNSLAQPQTQSITYTRSAMIDLNLVDPANPAAGITYTDWTTADGTWAAVVSPTIAGKVTFVKTVAAQMTTADTDDETVTVIYYPAILTVQPTAPKNEGDKVTPEDPADSREYPAGVSASDLNRTISRTITYVDANGNQLGDVVTQVVKYFRSATVDLNLVDETDSLAGIVYTPWATTDAEWPQVTSPAHVGLTPDMPEVAAVKTNQDTNDASVTVTYRATIITVTPDQPQNPGDKVDPTNPDDDRVYPAGVSTADLNRTITRTISYVDELGNQITRPVIQTVTYTRSAVLDLSLIDADDPGAGITYTDWTTRDAVWAAADSPTFTGQITFTKVVGAQTTTAETAGTTVTVTYYPAILTVQPTAPKNQGDKVTADAADPREYPAGVSASDLNRTITRTINYVDASGNQIAPSVTQTVAYYRSATVDLTRIDANDPLAGITYTAWATADGTWAAVASPALSERIPDVLVVAAQRPTVQTASTAVTVTYYPAILTVVPTAPKNQGDKVTADAADPREYPAGVSASDLTRVITRTIRYVDALGQAVAEPVIQTVTYWRIATVDLNRVNATDPTAGVVYTGWTTSDGTWAAADSPAVTGLATRTNVVAAAKVAFATPSQSVRVTYYPATITVTPNEPKNPGDKVDPANPDDDRVYPEGVGQADLNRTITRTIRYVDADGQVVADTVVQLVTYTREATIDLSGDVTYTAWTTANAEWPEVLSPAQAGLTTFTQSVAANTVAPDTPDAAITVTYFATTVTVAPGDPKNPGDRVDPTNSDDPRVYPAGVAQADLNRTITRTIRFVDRTGRELAQPVIQTVAFSRTATVTYAADGSATVVYGDWQPTQAAFAAYDAPAVAGYTARSPQVAVLSVTANDANIQDVVQYLRNPADPIPVPTPKPNPSVTPKPAPKPSSTGDRPDVSPQSPMQPQPLINGQPANPTPQNDSASAALPQTGETTAPRLSLLGLALTGTMSLLALFSFRRRRIGKRR